MIRVGVVLIGLLATTPAHPYYLSGNDLFGLCTGSDRNETYCQAYIAGAIDGFLAGYYTHCPLRGTTTGQVTDVLRKYLTEHPERRHEPASILVGQMLFDAFGCRRK